MSTIRSSGAMSSITAWQTPDELVGPAVVGQERDERRTIGHAATLPADATASRNARPSVAGYPAWV